MQKKIQVFKNLIDSSSNRKGGKSGIKENKTRSMDWIGSDIARDRVINVSFEVRTHTRDGNLDQESEKANWTSKKHRMKRRRTRRGVKKGSETGVVERSRG